ncbi:Hypothetical protein SCF082_LOCUS5458 [Durusdinium trenchii]|uniref:Uncharacterized protein n=1 Tax=Durusdinium trenchii TaxID=1381693 RepID=A0ABP0I9N0_9DINO
MTPETRKDPDHTKELLETGPPLVIAAPGLAKMGQDLAEKTGSEGRAPSRSCPVSWHGLVQAVAVLVRVGDRLQRVVAAVAERLQRETHAVRHGEKVLQECLTALEVPDLGVHGVLAQGAGDARGPDPKKKDIPLARARMGRRSPDIASVDWDSFPSGDPNIRFRWQDVQGPTGQHVVFLFDTVDRSRLFEQLALLQQLQGFPLPDADDSPRKWKTYAQEGRYAWGRAHRITVVIPWYRPCQMERTSRWEAPGRMHRVGGVPEGRWLDIPFAQSLAALLSAPAPQPPGKGPALAWLGGGNRLDSRPLVPLWRPPVTLFFVELHEAAKPAALPGGVRFPRRLDTKPLDVLKDGILMTHHVVSPLLSGKDLAEDPNSTFGLTHPTCPEAM